MKNLRLPSLLIFLLTFYVLFVPNAFAYTPGSTNVIDMNHYIQKFGFYTPTATYTIPPAEFKRLQVVATNATSAADKFNSSFNTTVEPELIVWWTYAEGIGGQASFSNCNDKYYATANCYGPASWQLGYGIQFSAIGLLKKAFTDMHGNPNNAVLVQQIGQSVLNYDLSQHTQPVCGGYSCTFPTMTVDQIMNGVNTSHETTNNWWASVLSRDPAINSYINADALQIANFNRQKAWGWGSYYKTHWQEYSNDLWAILKNWETLGGCPSNNPQCSGTSYTSTCSSLGQVCNTLSDCCSGIPYCGGGISGAGACSTTLACGGPGATCTSSNPCCTGDTCNNGDCVQNICSQTGQPCSITTGKENNCCSGVCTNSKCIAGTPVPPPPPDPCPKQNGICTIIDTAVGTIDVSTPGAFVKAAFGVILSVSGAIAILIIIFSGYGIMFSQRDPERIKGSQEMLTSAIVGLLFMIFSVTILHIIGYDIFRLPGF